MDRFSAWGPHYEAATNVGAAACHCFYGEATGPSFDEGIGSRYDEISGSDRAVPNWNVMVKCPFFLLLRSEILEEKFLVTDEVIRCSIVWFSAHSYASAECAGKSAPAGRQEHLASLCHAGRFRRRHVAPDKFFQRRGSA